MTLLLTNLATSTLAAGISAGATSLTVTAGEGTKFPMPATAGEWFPLVISDGPAALEIVKCTARAGDVLTVERAREGTIAQAFAAGARVDLRLTATAAHSLGHRKNLLVNGGMEINQRGGSIADMGRSFIMRHPFRWDSTDQWRLRADNYWENDGFQRGATLDRWIAYINQIGASGGAGVIEQVRCFDAPEWQPATAYTEGALVRPPASAVFGVDGVDRYVFRCRRTHVSDSDWEGNASAAIDPTSFQNLPDRWALYGLYETDPLLQGKYCLYWKQTAGSSAPVYLEQRILQLLLLSGGGAFAGSFIAKNRAGSDVNVLVQTILSRGTAQTASVVSSPTRTIGATARRLEFSVNLPDPLASNLSGWAGNNRQEYLGFRILMPGAAQTFRLLIAQVQFERGGATAFEAMPYHAELAACQAYFCKSNYAYIPARYNCYQDDAVAGIPQLTANRLKRRSVYDPYGRMKADIINWGGTNRAFPGNEHEFPNTGQRRAKVEALDKGLPMIGWQGFPAAMVRTPQVKFFDVQTAEEGYAVQNNRFKASLRNGISGVAADPRSFAMRSLHRLRNFGTTERGFDVQGTLIGEAAYFEDFSVSRSLAAPQDELGSSFLGLWLERRYDWTWRASGLGNGIRYLCLSLTAQNAAGTVIPAWASGVNYAVGNIVRGAGLRLYECQTAHLSSGSTGTNFPTNVLQTNPVWAPYGRVSMPFKIRIDGVEKGREDHHVGLAADLPAGGWMFGDFDALGFETVYARAATGTADLGDAAGRVLMQSYDNNADLKENLLFQWTADAETLVL